MIVEVSAQRLESSLGGWRISRAGRAGGSSPSIPSLRDLTTRTACSYDDRLFDAGSDSSDLTPHIDPPGNPVTLADNEQLYTNLTTYVSRACGNLKLVSPGKPAGRAVSLRRCLISASLPTATASPPNTWRRSHLDHERRIEAVSAAEGWAGCDVVREASTKNLQTWSRTPRAGSPVARCRASTYRRSCSA